MKEIEDIHYPERITSTMVVHIPFIGGYWDRGIEILDASIRSMRKSTTIPFDLMVLDNASCTEVQSYLLDLKQRGAIQFLLISDSNLGKVGAWNVLFQAAPGEIIVYSDSDVLFLPDWLEASLDVLRGFPKTGMVTAQPARGRPHFDELNSATIDAISVDTDIATQEGDLIPNQYLTAFCYGTGITKKAFRAKTRWARDIRISKNGIDAYVSASHFQFLTTKEMVGEVFPYQTARVLGDDIDVDAHINQLGYWRLSTTDYLVHHMGNSVPTKLNGYDGLEWLDPEVLSEHIAGPFASDELAGKYRTLRSPVTRFMLKRSLVRGALKGLHILTFKLLYEGN